MQDPFVPIDEEPGPSGLILSVVENSAYRPSRMLRNLCRIFSRQLVLQKVLGSRDIAMAFKNVFTRIGVSIKSQQLRQRWYQQARTKEDVAGIYS